MLINYHQFTMESMDIENIDVLMNSSLAQAVQVTQVSQDTQVPQDTQVTQVALATQVPIIIIETFTKKRQMTNRDDDIIQMERIFDIYEKPSAYQRYTSCYTKMRK